MMRNSISHTVLIALAATMFVAEVARAQQITIKIEKDEEKHSEPFRGKRAAADMAILLDTSNSMDGLKI